MEPKSIRERNRRLGLWVLLGMAVLAAVAAAFMFRTTGYRREVDRVVPAEPSLSRNAILVLGIFAVAAILIFGVSRILRPKR